MYFLYALYACLVQRNLDVLLAIHIFGSKELYDLSLCPLCLYGSKELYDLSLCPLCLYGSKRTL
jgi:uncharacterized protein (DUF2225 family)